MRALALLLLAQVSSPEGPVFSTPALMLRGPGPDVVWMSSLQQTGASECSGTAPTPTVGGAITVTRASSAVCTKADGTLVTLGNNQGRFSANGLLVGPTATNSLLRTEEMDNAAWSKASNVGTVTVAANNATAPDGTATADTVSFPAVSGTGNYAQLDQGITASSAARSSSIYLRRASGTSTIYLFLLTSGGAYVNAACAVSTTWSRCKVENVTGPANPRLYLGVDLTSGSGQAAQGAQDIEVWGAQLEAGALATSYIKTVGAAASRSADVVTAPTPALLSRTEGSMRVTFTPAWTGAAPSSPYFLSIGDSTARLLYTGSSSTNIRAFDGTNTATVEAGYVAGTAKSYRTTWSAVGNALQVHNLTAATSGTATAFTTLGVFNANIYLGGSTAGSGYASGTLKNLTLCKTASATECSQ